MSELLSTNLVTFVTQFSGFPLQDLVDVSDQSRMAAEVMDFDCEMKNASSAEFSEESELEIELESGESLDSDGALESRVIQPIVAAVTGQVM